MLRTCKRCGGTESASRLFTPYGTVCLPCRAASRDARIAKRKVAAVEYAKRTGYKHQKAHQKKRAAEKPPKTEKMCRRCCWTKPLDAFSKNGFVCFDCKRKVREKERRTK